MTVAVEPSSRTSVRPGGGLFRKGFWAILDQGLFAIANYMVGNILLARWLSQNDYGAYATAFTAFLLLGVIHIALLIEPMLVLGPGRYRTNLPEYFGALLRGHLLISLIGSALLAVCGIACWFKGQAVLAEAFVCFAAAAPFTLFLWLMRRACYAQMNPKRAAIAGIGYLVLMVAGLLIVHAFGQMNIAWAVFLMAASSMLVGAWLAVSKKTVRATGLKGPFVRDVASEHWHYGKWSTPTALLGYVPQNFFYFLLPAVATLSQSGALKALSNLYQPVGQANSALFLLLLPVFVKTRGTREGRRMHRLALLVLAGGPLVYWLVLGIFCHPVIHAMYAGKYDEYASLMWVLGLQQVIGAFCGVYGSMLRAHQKLNAVFWAGVVAAVTAVVLGMAMTRWKGLTGVCWSVVIAYAVHHLTLWLFSRHMHRDDEESDPVKQIVADIAQERSLIEPAAA